MDYFSKEIDCYLFDLIICLKNKHTRLIKCNLNIYTYILKVKFKTHYINIEEVLHV